MTDTRLKTQPTEVVPCEVARAIFDKFTCGGRKLATDLRDLARQLCNEYRRSGSFVSPEVQEGVYGLLREAARSSRLTITCAGSCIAKYTPVPYD